MIMEKLEMPKEGSFPVTLIHNVKEDTWHPVIFRYAPAPSGLHRWKSLGHDANGFKTLEEAQEAGKRVSNTLREQGKDSVFYSTFVRLWDGEDVPAMILFEYDFVAAIAHHNKDIDNGSNDNQSDGTD